MDIAKDFVSWSMVEDFVADVANHFKNSNVTGVYGIPAGGTILATLLSYKMDVPMLYAPFKNCIIIDDIADSGETLSHYRYNSSGNVKKQYHIVTMYYNESSKVKPDFFKFYKTNKWIVYPWEK